MANMYSTYQKFTGGGQSSNPISSLSSLMNPTSSGSSGGFLSSLAGGSNRPSQSSGGMFSGLLGGSTQPSQSSTGGLFSAFSGQGSSSSSSGGIFSSLKGFMHENTEQASAWPVLID